jgi:hypothetical protein
MDREVRSRPLGALEWGAFLLACLLAWAICH